MKRNDTEMVLVEFSLSDQFDENKKNIHELNHQLDKLQDKFESDWFQLGGLTRKGNKLRVLADY